MANHYVVYYFERLQDGHEEGAKVVGSLEEAIKIIEKWSNGFGGNNDNTIFKLFELGKEIPITEQIVEEKQVTVTHVRKFSVDKKAK